MSKQAENPRYQQPRDAQGGSFDSLDHDSGSGNKYLQIDQIPSNLTNLSPFVYVNRLPSNIYCPPTADMTLIETPAPNSIRSNYLQQLEEGIKSISRIILWANDQCQDQNQDYVQREPEQDSQTSEFVCSGIGELEENLFEPTQSMSSQKPMEAHLKNQMSKQACKDMGLGVLNGQRKKSAGRKKGCNCKKSQCLKLYCDCFRENRKCQGCACFECHNTQEFNMERANAKIILIDRNPEAFKPKIQSHSHSIGCNCKKTSCQKRYCECFQAGLACGANCKCEDCKNYETPDKQVGEKKIRQRIPNNFKLKSRLGPQIIIPVFQNIKKGQPPTFLINK